MRIAYRRMSGALPLGPAETGARGLWYEKRWALVRALQARGHVVDWVSRISTKSPGHTAIPLNRQHELLIIEFGSSNRQFYARDLDSTALLLAKHQGQVIFLCDDPDLPFDWAEHGTLKADRWTCWYNATQAKPFGGQPPELPIVDFPFSSLIEPARPKPAQLDHLVYYGRPNGRTVAIRKLLEGGIEFAVAGKPNEWDKWAIRAGFLAPPPQPQRAAWYAVFKAALVLADTKHKRLGWRTGRAYHAINAGCPIIAEHDHPAMSAFATYQDPACVAEYLEAWRDPNARETAWERQVQHVRDETVICSAAFTRAGL